jgi:hypothetical protein
MTRDFESGTDDAGQKIVGDCAGISKSLWCCRWFERILGREVRTVRMMREEDDKSVVRIGTMRNCGR